MQLLVNSRQELALLAPVARNVSLEPANPASARGICRVSCLLTLQNFQLSFHDNERGRRGWLAAALEVAMESQAAEVATTSQAPAAKGVAAAKGLAAATASHLRL